MRECESTVLFPRRCITSSWCPDCMQLCTSLYLLALASKRQPESSVAPVTSGRTDPPVHAVDAKQWPSLRHEQGLLLDTVRAPVDVEVCISWRLAAPCMGDELHM